MINYDYARNPWQKPSSRGHGPSKLTKQTCQTAQEPDMIDNSFLDLEICR